MEKTSRSTEANRQVSRILRYVGDGDSFTITSHGRPVARIVPARTPDREAAKKRLLAWLDSLPTTDIGPWTREELHD